MAIEKTYIMLKPDAMERGLVGEILARIERKGYKIEQIKTMQLDEPILREHYAHIADQPFFPDTLAYMTRGPVVAMVVSGENAVRGMRILMGATRFEDAAAGTIRGAVFGDIVLPLRGRRVLHRFFGMPGAGGQEGCQQEQGQENRAAFPIHGAPFLSVLLFSIAVSVQAGRNRWPDCTTISLYPQPDGTFSKRFSRKPKKSALRMNPEG